MPTKDEILRVHSEEMFNEVQTFESINQNENKFHFTGENEEGYPTYQNKYTTLAANLSAGSLISLIESDCTQGFAIIRPCSHHSFHSHGGGFCIYNSVMVGIRHF